MHNYTAKIVLTFKIRGFDPQNFQQPVYNNTADHEMTLKFNLRGCKFSSNQKGVYSYKALFKQLMLYLAIKHLFSEKYMQLRYSAE